MKVAEVCRKHGISDVLQLEIQVWWDDGIARLIGYATVLLMTQVLAQFGVQGSFHHQLGEMLQQAFFTY